VRDTAGARTALAGAVLLLMAGCTVAVSGLRPKSPALSTDATEFVAVESLQPVLRWEAFPTARDYRIDRDGWPYRAQNIRYDIQIFHAAEDYPGTLIYRRKDLPERWHQVEERLTPATRYFWTVRARFELGGEPRVTEWGCILPAEPTLREMAYRTPRTPSPFYYRFRTPAP
jgi:hypothetical protein